MRVGKERRVTCADSMKGLCIRGHSLMLAVSFEESVKMGAVGVEARWASA